MKTMWIIVTYSAQAHSSLLDCIGMNIVQSWEAVLEAQRTMKMDHDIESWHYEDFKDQRFGGMEGDENWLVYQRVQQVHIPEGV